MLPFEQQVECRNPCHLGVSDPMAERQRDLNEHLLAVPYLK